MMEAELWDPLVWAKLESGRPEAHPHSIALEEKTSE